MFGFGIGDDSFGFVEVGVVIEIGVYNICFGFDDGNFGVVVYKVDEGLVFFWDNYINKLIGL